MSNPESVRSNPHCRSATPYADALDCWSALGYAVFPAGVNKRPRAVRDADGESITWGPFSVYARTDFGHRAPNQAELTAWRRKYGAEDAGCLLLDSRPDLPLVAVDVDADDPLLFQWVEETFGPTPLYSTSGRGRHILYRAPVGVKVPSRSGMIGPPDAFAPKFNEAGKLTIELVSPIDLKAAGAYVLASGSWHAKRERSYTASQPITEELLQSLPIFDVALYEDLVATTKLMRMAAKHRRLTADMGVDLIEAVAGPSEAVEPMVWPTREQAKVAVTRLRAAERKGLLQGSVSASTMVETRGGHQALGDVAAGGGGPVGCPFHVGGSSMSARVWMGSRGDALLTCHSARCASVGTDTWVITPEDAPTHDAESEALITGWVLDGVETAESTEGACDVFAAGCAKAIFDDLKQATGAIDDAEKPAVVEDRDWCPTLMKIPKRLRRKFASITKAKTAGRYLRDGLLENVEAFNFLFIRAATGTGKTRALLHHLRRLNDRLGRPLVVMSISHRRSLVNELAIRLELQWTHMNSAGDVSITTETITSLAVCVDSLALAARQLEMAGVTIDCLILDESESTFGHLMMTTSLSPEEKRSSTFDALRDIVRSSKQVICSDATLSEMSIESMGQLTGLGTAGLLSRAALVEDDRHRATLSPLDLIWLAKADDAGLAALELAAKQHPFFYHVSSKARAKAIHAELRAKYPHLLWVLITGDHDDDLGNQFLRGPNAWIDDNRGAIGGVVYTTAMESGLSIDVALDPERGDSVVIEAGGSHTPGSIIQAGSRARRAVRWYVFAPEHGDAKWTDTADYSKAVIEKREDSNANFSIVDSWGGPRRVRDQEYFDSYVGARMHVWRSRQNLKRDLRAYLISEGYDLGTPTVQPRKETRAEQAERISEMKLSIKEAEHASIVAADASGLTVAQAEAVLDRPGDPDRHAAIKCLLGAFYGVEVDRALVEFDNNGRGRAQIVQRNELLAMLRGQSDAIEGHDRHEVGLSAGGTAKQRRATILWGTLELFGVTPEMIAGESTNPLRGEIGRGVDAWEGAPVMADPARVHARVWGWCLDPVIHRALKLTSGVDPWMQIPKDVRDGVIRVDVIDGVEVPITFLNALQNNDLACLANVTGVVSYLKRSETRNTSVQPPPKHTLNRLLTSTAAKLGLKVRSVSERTRDHVDRVPHFDLTRARLVHTYAAAHYQRLTGHPLNPVPVETEDAMEARHLEEARVIDREVAYERAPQADADRVTARHAHERRVRAQAAFVPVSQTRHFLAGSNPVSRSPKPSIFEGFFISTPRLPGRNPAHSITIPSTSDGTTPPRPPNPLKSQRIPPLTPFHPRSITRADPAGEPPVTRRPPTDSRRALLTLPRPPRSTEPPRACHRATPPRNGSSSPPNSGPSATAARSDRPPPEAATC